MQLLRTVATTNTHLRPMGRTLSSRLAIGLICTLVYLTLPSTGTASILDMLQGTWVGRCIQFGAAYTVDPPSFCMPYAAVDPISWTLNVTYRGTKISYFQARGASNVVTYNNVSYHYPRASDFGNLTSFTNYTGPNSNLFQTCISASFNRSGTASYLAGVSITDGALVYNEEGVWANPYNAPTDTCVTTAPQRLHCTDPGVFNYICTLTKFIY